MTPDKLAKSGTEDGQQMALFAFVAVAQRHGFECAWEWADSGDKRVFERSPYVTTKTEAFPVLDRLHAIPNGGLRNKATAAKLKATGTKRGVPDVFLPMPATVADDVQPVHRLTDRTRQYCGLYIELKRPKTETQRAGVTSPEQDDWIAYLRRAGYAVSVCFDWRSAAKEIERYVRQCV